MAINKGKRYSSGCRNHGTCEWCKRERLFHHYKEMLIAEEELRTLRRDYTEVQYLHTEATLAQSDSEQAASTR